jgi:hypothetical protein
MRNSDLSRSRSRPTASSDYSRDRILRSSDVWLKETVALMADGDRLPARNPQAHSQITQKLSSENVKAIINRGITLSDIAEFSVLTHSEDSVTRELALSHYNNLWKTFYENKRSLNRYIVSFSFGKYEPYAILLWNTGHIEYYFKGSSRNNTPFKWQRLVHESLAACQESAATLRGQRKNVMARQFYSALAILHSILDDTAGTWDLQSSRDRFQEAITDTEQRIEASVKELKDLVLQLDYQAAQRNYLLGMLPGLVIVCAIIAGIVITPLAQIEKYSIGIVLAGGGLGSLLSVLSRTTRAQLSRSLIVDTKASTSLIFCAGAFRPMIGALLGLGVYALIASGLIPVKVPVQTSQLYFFVGAISFLAGFSERLAQDALVRTSRGILGASNFGSEEKEDPKN